MGLRQWANLPNVKMLLLKVRPMWMFTFVCHHWRQGKWLQVAVRSDDIWESMHKIITYLDYFPKCQRCIGRRIISRNIPKHPRAPLSYFFFASYFIAVLALVHLLKHLVTSLSPGCRLLQLIPQAFPHYRHQNAEKWQIHHMFVHITEM